MLLLQMVQRGRQDWVEVDAGYGPYEICLDPQNWSVCHDTIPFMGVNHVEPSSPGNGRQVHFEEEYELQMVVFRSCRLVYNPHEHPVTIINIH